MCFHQILYFQVPQPRISKLILFYSNTTVTLSPENLFPSQSLFTSPIVNLPKQCWSWTGKKQQALRSLWPFHHAVTWLLSLHNLLLSLDWFSLVFSLASLHLFKCSEETNFHLDMSLLSYSLWASSGTKWSFTARRQWKMFLEIHVIYLKIILGKQLIYKIEDWLLDKKTHCWLNPESSKHNVYLAEVEHPTEIPDDARHFCNFLSAFFKLSSHTIASAYVSTHLQTTKQSKKRSHVHSCLRQWKIKSAEIRNNV